MLKEMSLKFFLFKQDITGYSFFKDMLTNQEFKNWFKYYTHFNNVINFYVSRSSEEIQIKNIPLLYFLDHALKKSLKDNPNNNLFSAHIDRIKKCLRQLFQGLAPWEKRACFIHDMIFGIGLVADKQKSKDILFKITHFYLEQKTDIELIFAIAIKIERFLEEFRDDQQLKASQYHFLELYQTCFNLYQENEKTCLKSLK